MHGNPDHHDAELLLRLYELRREEKLRQAREWFIGQFHAASAEELARLYPPGSEGDTYARMTVSYWDMAASIVNHGLIHEQFFFESGGELWAVWERARAAVPAIRERMKNPHMYENLEKLAAKYEKWMEDRAPGNIEARRQFLRAVGGEKPGASDK